jgi:hypothetical protein
MLEDKDDADVHSIETTIGQWAYKGIFIRI